MGRALSSSAFSSTRGVLKSILQHTDCTFFTRLHMLKIIATAVVIILIIATSRITPILLLNLNTYAYIIYRIMFTRYSNPPTRIDEATRRYVPYNLPAQKIIERNPIDNDPVIYRHTYERQRTNSVSLNQAQVDALSKEEDPVQVYKRAIERQVFTIANRIRVDPSILKVTPPEMLNIIGIDIRNLTDTDIVYEESIYGELSLYMKSARINKRFVYGRLTVLNTGLRPQYVLGDPFNVAFISSETQSKTKTKMRRLANFITTPGRTVYFVSPKNIKNIYSHIGREILTETLTDMDNSPGSAEDIRLLVNKLTQSDALDLINSINSVRAAISSPPLTAPLITTSVISSAPAAATSSAPSPTAISSPAVYPATAPAAPLITTSAPASSSAVTSPGEMLSPTITGDLKNQFILTPYTLGLGVNIPKYVNIQYVMYIGLQSKRKPTTRLSKLYRVKEAFVKDPVKFQYINDKSKKIFVPPTKKSTVVPESALSDFIAIQVQKFQSGDKIDPDKQVVGEIDPSDIKYHIMSIDTPPPLEALVKRIYGIRATPSKSSPIGGAFNEERIPPLSQELVMRKNGYNMYKYTT